MKNDDYKIEKAKEWFRKADNDIRTTEILMKDEQPPTDTACFHCHQAVEKHLKGYLTLKGIEFLKSHDLDYLLKLCQEDSGAFETWRESVLILNKYGIEPRYPADIPVYYPIDEAKEALHLTKEVINFVRGKTANGG